MDLAAPPLNLWGLQNPAGLSWAVGEQDDLHPPRSALKAKFGKSFSLGKSGDEQK